MWCAAPQVFVGVTSKNQIDRRGLQIPCYGWKRQGCLYSDEALAAARGASAGTGSKEGGAAASGDAAAAGQMHTLWRKGDAVELCVDTSATNTLSLRVNGKTVDTLGRVPTFRHTCVPAGAFLCARLCTCLCVPG